MEEARQHPALRALRWPSVALYCASFAAFILGVTGQIAVGGRWLQLGLTSWALLRFLAWLFAIHESRNSGRKQKRRAIANAVLWFVIAVAIGLSVNATLIWG
jgi:hypothetical protein